ncbi:histone deacetylase complex protein [Irpex rosettiformis]|uniref:Histone deacetylase complex protein n=1 Tax=Irpex rosettiformis TaxID=378272 RepID=A0ACB8TTG9_9APHY|nr:histone deacetylase complex protein [Irpex rosettiformis]
MSQLQTELQPNDEPNETRMDIDTAPSPKPPPFTDRRRPNPEGRRASSVPAKRQKLIEPRIGYVYDEEMLLHSCVAPDGHPEQPSRITRIYNALLTSSVLAQMKRIPARAVERDEALLVHSEVLWDKVMAIAAMGEQELADSAPYYTDLSLYVHPMTPHSARMSCGGVIEATLAVARGQMKKTFAIVRPPGHHSEPDEHMGFCFFNNVAVAARVVQQLTHIKKILILDWDVHHGNGTQRAFYDDPSVLYISLHRYENGTYYPNGPFGAMTSSGDGPGQGFSVNIPWPNAGMGDGDYLHAFEHIVMPIAMEFAPELVIISAGFDAAQGDDLGECEVSPGGYAHMTHMLSGLADGKLVVALEGGYSLDAISRSALAVAKVLLGEAPPQLDPLVASVEATETVFQVAMHQSQFWKTLNPKKIEPREDIEEISFSIPELLKAHRQEYLFRTHDMLAVPFASTALEDRFSSQVACTADIMDNETLVVFIHEFGNLRAELGSALTCDLHLEHSYLVDYSKKMIEWVKQQQYALLDVNVYPKPFQTSTLRGKTPKDDYSGELMVYLWDNYIQLTDARKIILIGHGPGCQALMHLLNNRTVGLMRLVKGVIQVVGNWNVPATPVDNTELRKWYWKHSAVFLPRGHRLFANPKPFKKHGKLHEADEPQPIRLLLKAFDRIVTYIPQMLNDTFAPN